MFNDLNPIEAIGAASMMMPGMGMFGGQPDINPTVGMSGNQLLDHYYDQARGGAKGIASKAQGYGTKALQYADDLVTPAARQANVALLNATGGIGAGGKTGIMGHIGRFAASPKALTLMKVGTGLGALGGVAGAADVLLGKDSAGNKLMDTAAMGIGGALGAVGGPMGIAAGAGIGKMVSDGAQFIFGGGKSAEERKMEEALALLRGGQI